MLCSYKTINITVLLGNNRVQSIQTNIEWYQLSTHNLNVQYS